MLKNKDVFLFDLDGTLLDIEIEEFLKYYFAALSAKFEDLSESREKFIELLSESTEKMIKNNGVQTNQEVFMEDFMAKIGIEDQKEALKIKKRFDDFYQQEFKALAKYFDLDRQISAEIIELLKTKKKRLVLATNPLFPVEAVEARLEWVGINPADFELLTHYENMSYAKPNPEYYRQILNKIGEKADNCLMVGNDLQEDGAASELGIKTLIVDDKLIQRAKKSYQPAWQGSLAELKNLIKKEL